MEGWLKWYNNDFQAALELFQTVYKYRLENLDKNENHPDIAECYNALGITYMKLNDKKTGIEYGHKSLDLMRRIFGENHIKVATQEYNLGWTYDVDQ